MNWKKQYEEQVRQNKILQAELDRINSAIVTISLTEFRKLDFRTEEIMKLLGDKVGDVAEAAKRSGNRYSPETVRALFDIEDALYELACD